MDVKILIIKCSNKTCDNTLVYSETDIKEVVGTVECEKCGQLQIIVPENKQ